MVDPLLLAELGPSVVRVTRRLVRFRGDGSGLERLSWGQQDLLDAMRRQESWIPLGAVVPLPAGTTVDSVAADLAFLVSRNQTLRTTLRFDPDGDRQVVAEAGEVPLDIVDAADDADLGSLAWEVAGRYQEIDYDYVSEWPVRAAVIRHQGVPTHLAMVACHLVTDGHGAYRMWQDLADRDPATGQARTPAARMQPMEQARWQHSEVGQRHSRAALRHWERLLWTVPARRFPAPVDRGHPRYWQGRFRSPALQLGVRSIVARTQVDTAPVLLGLYAVAMARLVGVNPVVVRTIVSNRFRPGFEAVVAPINQAGLCVLDVAGVTVDQVVAAAQRIAFVAYKYAYYDPRQLAELIARIGRERGEEIDLACYFNDRRFGRPDGMTGPPPSPDQLEAAVPLSTFEWERKEDEPFERLFLHINHSPDEADFTICADTHHLSPEHMQACVREMEAVAVAAAFDPAVKARP
jgi:hypothetical protein